MHVLFEEMDSEPTVRHAPASGHLFPARQAIRPAAVAGHAETRCSATRNAFATIVSVGFTLLFVTCNDESQTTILRAPHGRPNGPVALEAGSRPIRAVPHECSPAAEAVAGPHRRNSPVAPAERNH